MNIYTIQGLSDYYEDITIQNMIKDAIEYDKNEDTYPFIKKSKHTFCQDQSHIDKMNLELTCACNCSPLFSSSSNPIKNLEIYHHYNAFRSEHLRKWIKNTFESYLKHLRMVNRIHERNGNPARPLPDFKLLSKWEIVYEIDCHFSIGPPL